MGLFSQANGSKDGSTGLSLRSKTEISQQAFDGQMEFGIDIRGSQMI